MILNNLYSTDLTDSSGREYTKKIPEISVTEPEFTDAYWLGWLAWENLPSTFIQSQIKRDSETNQISITPVTVPENIDIGYSMTVRSSSNPAQINPSFLKYDETQSKWVPWTTHAGNASELRLPNKYDINTSLAQNVFLQFAAQISTTEDGNSLGEYLFSIGLDLDSFRNFNNVTFIVNRNTVSQEVGSLPNDLEFGITINELDGELHSITAGNYFIKIAMCSYGWVSFERDIKPDGSVSMYSYPAPIIRTHTSAIVGNEQKNQTWVIAASRATYLQAYNWLDGGGYRVALATGEPSFSGYSAPWDTSSYFMMGGYKGSYNGEDVRAALYNNTNLYKPEGANFFFQGVGRNDLAVIRRIYSYGDAYKHLALMPRMLDRRYEDIPFGNTYDNGTAENRYNKWYALVTSDDEFTGDFVNGSERELLKDWQLINQSINSETAKYNSKDDKPKYDPNESEQSIFFNKLIRFFKRRKPKYTQNGEENELIKYGQLINRLADLDDEIKLKEEDKLYLLRVLKDIGDNHYWNESVDDLIKDFNYYFYDNTIEEYEDANGQDVNKDSKIFHAGTLKNADAGANFVKEEGIVEKYEDIFKVKFPWVIPWLNLNRKSYRTVRGGDKNVDVLSNKEELQFTREEDLEKKYQQQIRLLMPKNLRKVEVEDLNRNFWVMGQVTSLLGSYLFGDDAIIPKTYNTILNEICQLWENIMYLWIATAAQSKKKQYTDVHCEVVPINSNSLLNYLKYDNFNHQIDTRVENNETLKHLSYLVDTYTDSNLLILLENRVNNYEHNCFSEIQYLLLQYDRNRSMWFYDINKIGRVYLDNDGLNFYWGASHINHRIPANQLYSINVDENNYYGLPMSEIEGISEISSRKFVTLIRPEYIISYEQTIPGILKPKIQMNFYDVSRDLLGKNNQEQKYLASIFYNEWMTPGAINYNTFPYCIITSNIEEAEKIETPIRRGYYQGELISRTSYTKQINWRTESAIYNYITPGMSFSDIKNHVTTNSSDQIYQQLGITNPKETLDNYSARFDLIRYSVGDGAGTSREMIPLAILTTKQKGVCEQHKLYLVKQGKTISDATAEDIPYTCANPLEMNGSVGKRCFLGPTYEDNILGKENGSINSIALYYSAFQIFNGQHPGAATTTTNIKNPILNIHSTTDIENPYIIDQFYLYNMDRYTLLLEMKEDYNNKNDNHKKFLRAAVIWRKTCMVDLEKGYIYWYDEIKRAGRLSQSVITLPEERLDWKCGEQFPLHVDEDFSYLDTCTNEMIERAWLKSNNGIIDF